MVKVTSERIPESQVRLSIEVEPERIAKSVDQAYRRLVNQVNIPGFRKGKAPRHVVERFVGRDALFQEGLEHLLNDVYREAIDELDLHPVDQPNLDLEPSATDLKPGDSLLVKATVPLQPTVELGDYQSIRIPRAAVEVTPEQVESIVERMREQQTEYAPVERPVQETDRVSIDVTATVGSYTRLYSPTGEPLVQSGEGTPFIDQTQVDFDVDKGSTSYPAGFADQLVGMVAGQEKHFELSLPADYSNAELASKLAVFKVTVHSVKEKHVPALDDEFAKAAGYDTFEALRADVRSRSLNYAEEQAREAHENAVVDAILSQSTFDIPPVIVNHEIDHLVQETRENLRERRLELAQYLAFTRKSEDELREEFRERALRNVKSALVLREVADAEHLEVNHEEVDQEIEIMALISGKDGDRVRQLFSTEEQHERIASRIRGRKTMNRLAGIALGEDEAKPAEATDEEAAQAETEAAAPSGEAEASAAGETATEPGDAAAAPSGEAEPTAAPESAAESRDETESVSDAVDAAAAESGGVESGKE